MADAFPAGTPAWRRWPASFGALSWADRVLLLETVLIVSLLPVVLRVVRVQRVAARLDRSRERSGGLRVDHARAGGVARVVAMGTRHAASDTTCLHRSLALSWLLTRRGLDGRLRMGVRRGGAGLDAHAWVEHGGVVLNDAPDVSSCYTPLVLNTSSSPS